MAVISLTQGVAKPYVVRQNDREDIYIRVGSTSRLASREQQARLFESGGMLHAELLPVSGTQLEDLDLARMTDYLVNIAGDESAPGDQAAWAQTACAPSFPPKLPVSMPSCVVKPYLATRLMRCARPC